MSEREWKPGDVAAVRIGSKEYVAIRTRYHGNECIDGGVWQSGYDGRLYREADQEARPLVVIDPEDKSFAEKIREYLDAEADWHGMHEDATVETLQDALRSLVAPPKPPEPTGLGAVVEDADGTIWVRTYEHTAFKHWVPSRKQHDNYRWDQINVARVLSEGVQP